MRREFSAIDELVRGVGASPPTPEGPGDDAALVGSDGELLAMDTMVEGVHFRRAWSSWADVGWKLLACNLSDMYAMGGSAERFLLSVALPEAEVEEVLGGIAEGLAEGCARMAPGLQLVGGDLTRSGQGVVVTIAMQGRVAGRALLRSGARPGMRLWINGEPGWAAAGLWLLEGGEGCGSRDAAERALGAHRRPWPRGWELPEVEGAAVDISDGLISDLWHVARASSVALQLEGELPGSGALLALAGGDVARVRNWQFRGGDDYCCVVASRAQPAEGFVEIGRVLDGPACVRDATGTPLEDGGHDHFGSLASR